MPLKVPDGRVYAFYVYNGDNVRELPSPDGETVVRADTLGHFCFKYSDDGGRSWSTERHRVPIRAMAIDRANVTGGRVQFFWGVGKPVVHEREGAVYIGVAKVGDFVADGFMASSEGIFLKSDNILTERDPAQVRWETLPDGDIGLRAPRGPIADEHNPVVMGDGSLYCTYRTVDGFLCHAYSRDGGHTWTPPAYAEYASGGRSIKHPRAANFVRRFSNGKYVLWFHNHGGRYYMDRNPAWLAGGIERDGHIHWSQPEIALYDDDPGTRMSYPDFIEQDGRYWLTETQKTIARVHEIDAALLEGLWRQGEVRAVARTGLALELAGDACAPGATAPLPRFGNFAEGAGLAVELWLTLAASAGEQVIFNTRNRHGRGITLALGPHGALRLTLGAPSIEAEWESDPGLLRPGQAHHVVAIVDGGPRLITFVVDGILCDGGVMRPKGWGRFPRELGDLNGKPPVTSNLRPPTDGGPAATFAIDPELPSTLHLLRIYDRALRTSEAVGNFLAGQP